MVKKGLCFMKKIIRRRLYDTQEAVLVKKYCVGVYGDPYGYEEILWQTTDGHYFLYVNGGAQSPYTKENLRSLSKEKAMQWLELHS